MVRLSEKLDIGSEPYFSAALNGSGSKCPWYVPGSLLPWLYHEHPMDIVLSWDNHLGSTDNHDSSTLRYLLGCLNGSGSNCPGISLADAGTSWLTVAAPWTSYGYCALLGFLLNPLPSLCMPLVCPGYPWSYREHPMDIVLYWVSSTSTSKSPWVPLVCPGYIFRAAPFLPFQHCLVRQL